MKRNAKIVQSGVPPDRNTAQRLAADRASADYRMIDQLRDIARSNNEYAAWCELISVREYLCIVPVSRDLSYEELESRNDYLRFVLNFLRALDMNSYCDACNELADLIHSGCTRYAGMRDVAVHFLAAYTANRKPPAVNNI